MILLAALLVSLCCGSWGAAAGGSAVGLERIEHCGTTCSQGLRCKNKPQALFYLPCQKPIEDLNASSVFRNVSVTTVMRCEGRQKCSLHLRVSTDLHLTAAVQGLTICAATAGMMASCRTLSFTKASRERMSGMQVNVMNDCAQVSPGQHLKIKVITSPNYCDVVWTGTYQAPGCTTEDLKQNVPDCITGRLSYDVNPEKKELAVSVSDMLEGYDYHLRLCHKDFICTGTSAKTLIKKEDPIKKALLQYSRPLPCLCIEGWSAITDAHRVQVCPFKERLEELWFGINFESLEGRLWWEPACPVTAAVALCQRREEDGGICVDLPGSFQNVSKGKITFTEVDPHPRLCMKFIAGSQSWIRCPFTNTRFQEREVVVVRGEEPRVVSLLPQINATYSVGLCAKGEDSSPCQTTQTHTLHTVKHKSVAINLPGELCNVCVQVKRVDVKFAVTEIHCVDQCNQTPTVSPVISHEANLDLTWIFVPTAITVCGVIILILVSHVLLNVYHRRKQKLKKDCRSQQQTDSAFECVIPALQAKPVRAPDSPQSEKVNLISD